MTASISPPNPTPLPPLFSRPRSLLGWQGITATLPDDWFLRSFGGSSQKGTMRVIDDDGTRLEIIWETPQRATDVQKSIDNFLDGLKREAKKKKQNFRLADHPDLLERRGREREQLTNFGWIGEAGDPVASQGWGAAWQCATCGRVVVCHMIGRNAESTSKTQRLAAEVLSSISCHGSGGWQTWSVFGLRVDVPEEFRMESSKLLAGRIELRWARELAKGGASSIFTPNYLRSPERLALVRVAAANVILEDESLADWTVRTISNGDKKRRFEMPQPQDYRSHEGIILRGRPRDLRRFAFGWMATNWFKKPPPAIEMRVWHDTDLNKIFVLDSELSAANSHILPDVLDSMESH